VCLGPGAYVGQKVIQHEQKTDAMPNNIFVTKVTILQELILNR